jgi:hypothetical protein
VEPRKDVACASWQVDMVMIVSEEEKTVEEAINVLVNVLAVALR